MDYRSYGAPATAGNAVTYTGVPSGPVEPENPSAIRDAVTNSEQLLSDLHVVIDVLEKRLDTVLLPVPPQVVTTASAPTPQPVSSHVRGRLNILNDGYRHGIERISGLTRRVEV